LFFDDNFLSKYELSRFARVLASKIFEKSVSSIYDGFVERKLPFNFWSITISLRDGAKDRTPLSFSLSLSLTHTHTHTHTRTHTHTHTHSLYLSHTHSLSFFFSLVDMSHSLTLSYPLCGLVAHTHTIPSSLCGIVAHTFSLSRSLTHSHTHTHAHAHLMLSPGCRHKPCFRHRSPTTRLRLLPMTILHEAKIVSHFFR